MGCPETKANFTSNLPSLTNPNFIFSELFKFFEPIYNGYFQGNITLMDSLDVNPYWFVFILTVVAILMFAASDLIRKRVKKVFY